LRVNLLDEIIGLDITEMGGEQPIVLHAFEAHEREVHKENQSANVNATQIVAQTETFQKPQSTSRPGSEDMEVPKERE
jgi:hypothetical protein